MSDRDSAGRIRSDSVLLAVRDLWKFYPVRKSAFSRKIGFVQAVCGIHFEVRKGKTLALVGESGSGKTTTARILLRLEDPDQGEVVFEGQDILKLRNRSFRFFRRNIQMVFQDPYSSLNPHMTAGQIIAEPLQIHRICRRKQLKSHTAELLVKVGLSPESAGRFPHEFSGGQRQRLGIARALALNPKLIICDEPVSALDVSIRAQILNLLHDLQDQLGLTYVFIGHDLSIIKHVSHDTAVMYMGKILEKAPTDRFFMNPLHPYSEALLSACPVPDPGWKKERILLPGDVPSPIDPPSGCRFHTRCPLAADVCVQQEPPLRESAQDHSVACFFRG